jgi:hypothetical protein
VLFFHCVFQLGLGHVPATTLLDWTWTGLDIFLVLSGYLITRILLAAPPGTGYFLNFFLRRALRISLLTMPRYCSSSGCSRCSALTLRLPPRGTASGSTRPTSRTGYLLGMAGRTGMPSPTSGRWRWKSSSTWPGLSWSSLPAVSG